MLSENGVGFSSTITAVDNSETYTGSSVGEYSRTASLLNYKENAAGSLVIGQTRTIGASTYCEGNIAFLEQQCNFSVASARASEGRWVKLAPGTPQYAAVPPSDLQGFVTDGVLPPSPDKYALSGTGVVGSSPVVWLTGPGTMGGVLGPDPWTESIAVATNGLPLVVKIVGSCPVHKPIVIGGQKLIYEETIDVSNWGKSFDITRPAHALPYSSLH
jgi:hypothetical protein